MKRNQKSKPEKQRKQEWPVMIHVWMIGLVGTIIGIPLGWLGYRWRGEVI